MWEASAEYADGTTVKQLFNYRENTNEEEQQYQLECWLLERNKKCVWYSVVYIECPDETEDETEDE